MMMSTLGYKKTAIIDGDSVAFSIFNGVKLLDEAGNPIREDGKRFVYRDKTEEELLQSTDYIMNQILTQGNFDSYILYIKGLATTHYRTLVNPEYKQNRPKESPKFWKFVKDTLICRWGAVECHGAEVDDYVLSTYNSLDNSHITAIDKDLLFIETLENRPHFNWRKNDWITVTYSQAAIKFWSDMICGQNGDNVKGLEKRGEAFVKKLFERYPAESYSLRQAVFDAYIKDLGEYEGIKQFWMNYHSLKLLDTIPGYTIPEPIEFKPKTIEVDISHLFA